MREEFAQKCGRFAGSLRFTGSRYRPPHNLQPLRRPLNDGGKAKGVSERNAHCLLRAITAATDLSFAVRESTVTLKSVLALCQRSA
jgi:hypothetical protein